MLSFLKIYTLLMAAVLSICIVCVKCDISVRTVHVSCPNLFVVWVPNIKLDLCLTLCIYLLLDCINKVVLNVPYILLSMHVSFL